MQRKSICMIAGGLTEKNFRLQPWRYLSEVARQLANQGHTVTVLTDGCEGKPAQDMVAGVPVWRLPSVSAPLWTRNEPLRTALRATSPDIILWHVGLTSFLHQQLEGWSEAPVVGIFTSPVYRFGEIARLGARRVIGGYKLSAVHVLGTLLPKVRLRHILRHGVVRQLVVQSHATRERLLAHGVRPEQATVIVPGIDNIWSTFEVSRGTEMRAVLGFSSADTVVLYFGSPAPLRGLHSLIRAVKIARRTDPSIKLLVLSRRRADELMREDAELRRLLQEEDVSDYIKVVSAFLDETALVSHAAACDVAALPFEIIPSDAPLSLLEAQALGKPVVTTTVGCLGELVDRGPSYLAEPANPQSLANALLQAAVDLRAHNGGFTRPVARSWQQMGEEWSTLVEQMTQHTGAQHAFS